MGKRLSHDWTELPLELLELVVSKLPSIERPRFSAVCSSWNAASKSKSGFPPLLLLPLKVRSDDTPVPSISSTSNQEWDNILNDRVLRFYSLDVKRSILCTPPNKKIRIGKKFYDEFDCVGSSHGWIVILDLKFKLLLINPFTGAEIELPQKKNLPFAAEDLKRFPHLAEDLKNLPYAAEVALPLIDKAILTGNPSDGADYKVVVIYGYSHRLAFCSHGDKTWTDLTDSRNAVDMACCGNKLYTLELHYDAVSMIIDVWDLSMVGKPQRSSHLVIPSINKELNDVGRRYPSSWKVSCYLVPSLEETFLVVRVVGKLDADSGFMVGSQGDFILYRESKELFSPYITHGFQVYKVVNPDNDGKVLVKVESLVGRAIFVGKSDSMLISVRKHDELGLKHNSIYFTDDNWDKFIVDHKYGGHDFGIYSLEDKSVRLLFDPQTYTTLAPFWVFPGRK